MEQRGFARTGFPGDQGVLTRAFAYGQVLQLGCARATDGNAKLFRGFLAPYVRIAWCDFLERHFDSRGIFAALAHLAKQLCSELGRRRRIQQQADSAKTTPGELEPGLAARNANA